MKCFAQHFPNRSSQIDGIGFYQSYNPVSHVDSFQINIAIVAMNQVAARILDVINAL